MRSRRQDSTSTPHENARRPRSVEVGGPAAAAFFGPAGPERSGARRFAVARTSSLAGAGLALLSLWTLACSAARGPLRAGPGSALADAAPAPPAVERPNILILFADDQRPDTISAWGNEVIETPNIDRLVARGTSFRHAYNLGSVHGAVCMPSRAMLNTGHPYFGMNLSTLDGRPTLGGLLGAAGYRTFGTGKWHNGRETFARSFQSGRSIFFGGMSDHNQVPLNDWVDGEYDETHTGEGHSSEMFADAAVDFLSGHEGDEPFFCYVAFTAPHDPRDPPEAALRRFGSAEPPLPPNFLPQHPFDNGFLTVRDEGLGPWPRTEAVVRSQLREYYALIEDLDAQVGRVLEALEARGDADRTIVVYAADHGLALGSHGLLGKQSLYEHSTGTPLILAGPGVPRGASRESLVYLLDLFPTLLGLAGVEPPSAPYGADLLPVCRGEVEGVRDAVGLSMGTTQRAWRDGRYKLIRYPKVDRTQLFDLEADPDERVDLSGDPEQAGRLAAMKAGLRAWQAEAGDDLAWTAEELAPAEVDLTGRDREPDRWQPKWIRAKYFGESPD